MQSSTHERNEEPDRDLGCLLWENLNLGQTVAAAPASIGHLLE